MSFELTLFNSNREVLYNNIFSPHCGLNTLRAVHKHARKIARTFPSAVRMLLDIAL